MKTPPADLDHTAIRAALWQWWSIDADGLRYAPLGFGSHHWIATTRDGDRWFVTVDDVGASHLDSGDGDGFNVLARGFRAALTLRDEAHLAFVVGPLLANSGDILLRLTDRYAISVFPFLDVEPYESGEFRTEADRADAMRLVAQVHNATRLIPPDALRRETFAILDRERLLDALGDLDRPWRAGPFGEPARRLLRDHARPLQAALERFDRQVTSVLADTSDWVVTHGEPHAANVVRTRSGELVMVDWDTAAFGPRERDMWTLVGDAGSDWSAYREATGVNSLSAETMRAYRLHWDLSEIAVFTTWCRGVHERTQDMEIAWQQLQRYVKNTA